jgi:hypothetical protein
MTQTITLQLPSETLQRYQRGAAIAHRSLNEFLVERLAEAIPPLADDLPSPLDKELKRLEELDDEALWKVAKSRLPPASQRVYSHLLRKNSQGTLTMHEKEKLHTLGEEARCLTLKKAHAYMLLKWRGYDIPSLEELQETP